MQFLEGKAEAELKRIALARAPHEAVGILYNDGTVIELINHAEVPEMNFVIRKEEVWQLTVDYEKSWEGMTLWHTHPGGGIGPSRTDMQNKTAFPYHLVVTIMDNEVVPTWY